MTSRPLSLGRCCRLPATVVIAIGILTVLARPLVDRWTGGGRVISALPRISAVVIIIIGAFMAIRALVSGGIITVNL